ncbi:amino acid ABC transporter ATP-binding protein [Variovorax sp. PBL-E5]|uniref:amino acid ABC transporter ATP-binding protein n=1 Tax=Variovorax sp. PBL-E5 TaxID=434014 RepID=UPI00131730AF|nr:amino acid ABC transporter ATP-binding protein [Variovorax sp. PBL-E5]VTU45450.1 Octopine permease ATP-binding protein P [Variovorax sp. PBL-E5]
MNPIAVARDVWKSFGDVQVLRGISLEMQAGEVFGIVGPSGSGKSTFLRCFNQLETIDRGELFVNGEVVGYALRDGKLYQHGDRKIAAQRSQVGMVFQKFNLFPHMTVLENVASGPVIVKGTERSKAEAQARRLLDRVGLASFCDRYPSQLSGGQQQRVAIARAIAMEPTMLLLDEPTSALDSELVGEVLAVMKDLAAEGRTMILVTHELAFAREVCDRVAFMEDGCVVECGPPEQLFGNPRQSRTREFLQRLHRPAAATSPVIPTASLSH